MEECVRFESQTLEYADKIITNKKLKNVKKLKKVKKLKNVKKC